MHSVPSSAFLLGSIAAAILSALPAMAGEATNVEVGRRIYQEGILPDGSPLIAIRSADGEIKGRRAACVSCHRRSGMGASEGRYLVPPITGPILFTQPVAAWPTRPGRVPQSVAPLRHLSRAAYSDETLARAIRDGIDSSGRPMAELMPHYPLDEDAATALNAYLRQLSAALPPGIVGDTIHLATILTPDAEPQRKQLVQTMLQAWSEQTAVIGMTIALHVWELHGNAETWDVQLHAFYRQQPVYAVLSGAGGARWEPVQAFCERAALPCLFPVVDLAPERPEDFYSMYLSAGVTLEAQILAEHLATTAPQTARIVQLVADDAGRRAADHLARRLGEDRVEFRRYDDAAPRSALSGLAADDILVAWLTPDQFNALAKEVPAQEQPPHTYLPAWLAPPARCSVPELWKERVFWVSGRSDSRRLRGRGVLGLIPWLDRLKLPVTDEATQAEIYAAIFFFGDALAQMRGRLQREFLLERLEMAVDNRPAGAAYYNLSLGPGQRIAAKSGHLQGFPNSRADRVEPIGPRIAAR